MPSVRNNQGRNRVLTDEGCLEEVRPPEHLVHGADGAELEPPILDLEDAVDVGHEDH